ncbi:hypothetical protein R3P38DRAFT_3112013 [Favolaschia claudopus]|uniref:Uncharacterized protein n=1 Tax=Favolaschia claudopus TaxID=2862362 RepID=A0AAV9ZHZ7_9AGAR
MLISDLVPAVKINPTILQNKSLVLDLDRIKETAQFRKARAANPGIVVALKDARYALFERAKARADESGSEVPVGDIRLLGGSFMRTDPPNLALNQLILTIRRVHQADGAFAVQHSARKAIPEAWSQTVESNSTWSAGFHDEVRENLTTHILPIITEIHGGILPSIPCGTQAARDLPPPPETYPSFFKFETKYIPPQEATGRWKGSLPTISEVIITAASQMRESAVSPMPGLLEALRHARSSDIDESLDCRTFNFNRLLYRFCKLQEFINIHQELLTTADGRVIERVMTIMTTVATTCPIVCHTSLIWAWAQYALEHVFMDSYAHETSSVARQKVAQVFEQLSLFLECIALYAVTGSTVGLSIENPITSKINVAKNKRFQCETQAYCCGFLECPEELLKEHDAASGREKHEHSISTCQYSARVGNRRLLEEMEGGWLGHLSYFPCLESLWLYAFIPAVASHALISAFQGHFVEKAARGKTTRWAMLALNV